MNPESKVTAGHLQRSAYLYIRQSTLRQVFENTESTQRQYALRRRAVSLGWPEERIVVIDHDQGQSGASTVEREGFQRLVADVGLGKAGIVMGLEVSRLARNCADWHRLLEICGLTHTLILDEDGLYDPGLFNDRLLLGLKGTMSEAELHVLKARLVGGVLSKAQRGELKMPLPIGLVYDDDDHVQLDPDQQVQQSLRNLFATFRRTGSAWATMRAFRQEGWKFPCRGQAGSGGIFWRPLSEATVLQTLHNPRYAGTFCFGRTRSWKDAEGRAHVEEVPRDQWRFVRPKAHPGYLSWDDFLTNESILRQNHQRHGGGVGPAGPAREGPALLQGLVLCGKCGRAMTVRYHQHRGRMAPDYVCQKTHIENHDPLCQQIPGSAIDDAVGQWLVESVTPMALEVVLQVQSEIQTRLEEAGRLRQQQVQRAQYEAEQAKVRYLRVDPNNRLVADTLESQWNQKLQSLAEAREEAEKHRRSDEALVNEEQRSKVLALATDFPRLWMDPKTTDRDRKRMARLLVEDVTLKRDQDIVVQLRCKGGATRELRLPLPKTVGELRRTKSEIVTEIDRLLADHTEAGIAELLNERGWKTGTGHAFTLRIVNSLRRTYRLRSRFLRLREKGLLTRSEVGPIIGCAVSQVKYWRHAGVLTGFQCSEKDEYLYQPPTQDIIQLIQGRRGRRPSHPNPGCLSLSPQGAV